MSDPILDIIKDIVISQADCMAKSFEINGMAGIYSGVDYNLVFIKINTFNNNSVYLNLNKEQLTEVIRTLQHALRKMEMMRRERTSVVDNFEEFLERVERSLKEKRERER